MKAIAANPKQDSVPAKNHRAAAQTAPAVLYPTERVPFSENLLIQRKASCACGGGCPRCQQQHHFIQPKLSISHPGDQFEQEADRVADQVMRMPAPNYEPVVDTRASPGRLQRKCSSCTDDDETRLSRKEVSSHPGPIGSSGSDVVGNVLRSSGHALDHQTRAYFEPRFGHDFSDVRIHTGASAAESARAVNARAYTSGRNIVFGAGEYASHTDDGMRLLAHELAHVVQQRGIAQTGGSLVQRKKCHRIEAKTPTTADKVPTLINKPSKNGSPCACLVVIHNKEQNAHETAEVMHQHCAYNLTTLEPENASRNMLIPGHTEKKKDISEGCDPNALFAPGIAEQCLNREQTCHDFITQNAGAKETETVMKFVQMKFFLAVKECSAGFSLPVIALHNNDLNDTRTYLSKKTPATTKELKRDLDKTITEPVEDKPEIKTGTQQVKELRELIQKRFSPKVRTAMTDTRGKTNIFRWCVSPDIVKCHIGDPDKPDHVIWVTNEDDFSKLNTKDVNVVLQNQASSGGESVGDLSTLFIVLKELTVSRTERIDELTAEVAATTLVIDGIKRNLDTMIQSGSSTFAERMKARWNLLEEITHRLWTQTRLSGVQGTPALDTAKIRFTNIETPGFAFSEQTDDERKSNYQLISDVISALGIQNCCGADATAVAANEAKIKQDLELKNIQAREKQAKEAAAATE